MAFLVNGKGKLVPGRAIYDEPSIHIKATFEVKGREKRMKDVLNDKNRKELI